MNHKDGKWAKEILDSRNAEGMWGNFHTLSKPASRKDITTEQAIRRLKILGFTKEDEAIQIVLERMCQCVSGERKIDQYSEKTHDWPLFEKLMLSAWIRLFDPANEIACQVARQWAQIAEQAFSSGQYNAEDDEQAFTAIFGRKPKSGFETGFGMFYHAALLQGIISSDTERMLLEYYLTRPQGIYYIYDQPLSTLPEPFASRKASNYLAAIELLAGYHHAPQKLMFVSEWLEANRNSHGRWDMGASVKDGVYFPLRNSWRRQEDREADHTERITELLRRVAQ